MNALALLFGFFGGIALFSIVPLQLWGAAYLLLVGFICLGIAGTKKRHSYFLTALALIAAALGGMRTELHRSVLPSEFVPLLESEVMLEGKVVADPDVRETTARLTLLAQHEGAKTKVLVVAPLFPEIRYGETIRATGTLVRPEAFETDGGRTFRYDQFLAKDGIYVLLERASVEIVAPREGIDHVRGFFSDLKFAGIDALSVALPEPQASLASGLVLGGKQGLGEKLLDDFIVVGLVHIVVLSGYNVMIVAEAVFRTVSVFARRYAAFVAGAVIFGFVLVAGAGAASIRAGLMAGIALFARASGRTYDAARALCAAAVLMLLINPLLLVHDPGFQLSFVATLGLIFGGPIVERWIGTVRPAFLREIVAATIAAQIAVLPLLLYQNGLFSLVSLPVNVLVLPLVPLAMGFSALAGLAGFLVPSLAPLVGLPAYALLSLIVGIVEFTAALPFAAFTVPAFPAWIVAAAYLALGWYVKTRYVTASR